VSNLFQKVEFEAFRAGITPRTRESRAWFRKRVQNMKINRRELMDAEMVEKRNKSVIGSMYMFFYDAKLRESLPYWDSFPVIIAVGPAKGGFYGLNLHYLPIPLRAKFLDNLMDITNNKKFDESTKFGVSYEYLKGASKMRYFKPCFKHYLTSQVEGQLSYIPPPEWEIATFLPAAQWQKGGQSQAYKDSTRMIS
jgi:hypothetical protein